MSPELSSEPWRKPTTLLVNFASETLPGLTDLSGLNLLIVNALLHPALARRGPQLWASKTLEHKYWHFHGGTPDTGLKGAFDKWKPGRHNIVGDLR